MLVIRCSTSAVDETRALAAALALAVGDQDLILLLGDLGAGKTAFTQGFAAALGVVGPVTSPTFTLANRYVGALVINHLDAYRVEDLADAEDLALPELLESGVTLIEWGDKILAAVPNDRLDIRITFGESNDDRHFEFATVGPAWLKRHSAITAAVTNWADLSC